VGQAAREIRVITEPHEHRKNDTMSTSITTHNPVRSDLAPGGAPDVVDIAVRPSGGGRGWALAGIGAGLAGIGTIVTSSMVDAVYDKDLVGDTPGVLAKLADQTAPMFAFHTFSVVGAVLMIVFAAGLFRRLRAGAPETSTAPLVAFAGMVGTALVSVLGSGLDTEFMLAFVQDPDIVDPANAALYNHWIGTIPWLWVLAGLAGVATWVVSRSQGTPRWIGRVGLVLGGLTLLLGISPLQYMAGMTGPLWLLVTAIGFAAGDRAFRASRAVR
jgi:hypothetical protein